MDLGGRLMGFQGRAFVFWGALFLGCLWFGGGVMVLGRHVYLRGWFFFLLG